MFRSLWFKLSVCFTALTTFSVCVLNLISLLGSSYLEFHAVVVPENVRRIVISEQLLFAEAVREPLLNEWWILAKRNVSDKLTYMHDTTDDFNIRPFRNPKLYFRVIDSAGKPVFSEPETMPSHVGNIFDAQKSDGAPRAEQMEQDGHIWVTAPLTDAFGQSRGHIDLLFMAQFDIWEPLGIMLQNYVDSWYVLLLLFSICGLMCGLVATWFVTGRLGRINAITSVWREGNLSPRIVIDGKSEDSLTEHSRRLNAMADDLESLFALRQKIAITEERNRVARELHDTVKQNLFALKLQLATIHHKNRTDDMKVHIEEAEKITREAQQDLMEILTQLHPATHGEKGFYGRMATLTEDMSRRFDIAVEWGKKDPIVVTPEQEHALIRLAQEAMSNAVRHGRATKIIMNLFRNEKTNEWTIANNGAPLAVDANASGFGLVSMQARAAELPGGEFSIGNDKKGGVVVTIRWDAN